MSICARTCLIESASVMPFSTTLRAAGARSAFALARSAQAFQNSVSCWLMPFSPG
jgi:hypothetical protein